MTNIDFPVIEKKLITADGINVPSHKVIIREDTNQILGVVGKDYKVVRHREALDALEQSIPTELIQESITLCKNGAVMFAKYRTPKLENIEVKVGDMVRFGIEIFNGLDGTMKVGFMFIGDRLACSNGMVVPRTIANIMQKHTGGLEIHSVEDEFTQRIPMFTMAIEKWKQWSRITPSGENISGFFSDYLGKRLGIEILDQYNHSDDKTLWGLFNILTSYRTHDIRVRDIQNKRLVQMKFDTLILDKFYEYSWN